MLQSIILKSGASGSHDACDLTFVDREEGSLLVADRVGLAF